MRLTEFKEKYSLEIMNGENTIVSLINQVKENIFKTHPEVFLELRIGKWVKTNNNFFRWPSSIKVGVKNSNSDVDFDNAIKMVQLEITQNHQKFFQGKNDQFYNFNLQICKHKSFRSRQIKSSDYKDFVKWIGTKELYPGDKNKHLFQDRIQKIKGDRSDSESSGERLIRLFLEDNKVKFKQYHKIKGCYSEKNGKKYSLIFDFYVPSKNLVIEYDGKQHFSPVSKFGGQDTFERTVLLDSIKNRFCRRSEISLLRIPYTKKTSEIYTILHEQIIG